MAAVGPAGVQLHEGDGVPRSKTPGEPTQLGTALESGVSEVLQSFKPTSRIHAHLCAFHFYAHDMTRQVEAHHYCTHYNQDVHQCLIYDTPNKDARLIGVEYIVSEKIFLTLPEEEKKLWHSHEYEVKSGVLFMPGLPGTAEGAVMRELCKTYGKVFHFWQFDRGDPLPLGPPQLMMALTADGQLKGELAQDVERRFGVSFNLKRQERHDMEGPSLGIHPGANSWLSGRGLESQMCNFSIMFASFSILA